MRFTDYILVLISTFCLGVNYIAVKIGVSEFPPLFMVAMRFTLVATILIWFAKPPGKHLFAVIQFSFTMGVLHFGLIFIGFQHVDASVVAIIFQLGIPFSVIFARIFLGEKFGWRRWLGIIIAFAGTAIIAGAPQTSSNIFYFFVLLVSVLAWSASSVQVKRMKNFDAISLSAWMTLFAAPQLYLASFILETGQITAITEASLAAWGGLLFTVFGASIIGYGLWYHLIGKLSISRVYPFGFLATLFGIASAILFLDEQLTFTTIIGAILVLSGVIIIQIRSLRKIPSTKLSKDGHDQALIT